MSDDDAELVALIDNELDESRRASLLARLAADEQLRQRYEELREAGAPLAASFDELLRQAPLARLRAALPAEKALRQPPRRFGGIAVGELAAGFLIGLLVAGAAAWAFGLIGEREDWRSAVAEYTQLYSNETFSPLNPDAALQAAELSFVGSKVGANLTPENVSLPGLRFTTAFMLSYGGSPLWVIAYVDPSRAPVLLCILANRAPNGQRVESNAATLAWWSRNGRTHLIIGRIPQERAAALAQALEKRV